MNIFVTDSDPVKSAQYLDDKRVIKMILESAQLLSTALRHHGCEAVYKSTHVNHPCSLWVRESKQNYLWLLNHFKALCTEYTLRYNKIHKCEQYYNFFLDNCNFIPDNKSTSFVNCTNFKHIENIFDAYKICLDDKWKNDKRAPTWYKTTRSLYGSN